MSEEEYVCGGLFKARSVIKCCTAFSKIFILAGTLGILQFCYEQWDAKDETDKEHNLGEILTKCAKEQGEGMNLQDCYDKANHADIQAHEEQGLDDSAKAWIQNGVSFGMGYAGVWMTAINSYLTSRYDNKDGDFKLGCFDEFLIKWLLPPFSCWSSKPCGGIFNWFKKDSCKCLDEWWIYKKPEVNADQTQDEDSNESGNSRSQVRREDSDYSLQQSVSYHPEHDEKESDEYRDSVALAVSSPPPSPPALASSRRSRLDPNANTFSPRGQNVRATEFYPGRKNHVSSSDQARWN